jgi:hypothetical protein
VTSKSRRERSQQVQLERRGDAPVGLYRAQREVAADHVHGDAEHAAPTAPARL